MRSAAHHGLSPPGEHRDSFRLVRSSSVVGLPGYGLRPWLDEEDILPGQDWESEIRRAIRKSRYVLVCLSESSVTKSGFIHKEIKQALDIADEQPSGTFEEELRFSRRQPAVPGSRYGSQPPPSRTTFRAPVSRIGSTIANIFRIVVPLAVVAGLVVAGVMFGPGIVEKLQSNQGPIVNDAVGPAPWVIEGQGYRYEIEGVARRSFPPETRRTPDVRPSDQRPRHSHRFEVVFPYVGSGAEPGRNGTGPCPRPGTVGEIPDSRPALAHRAGRLRLRSAD